MDRFECRKKLWEDLQVGEIASIQQLSQCTHISYLYLTLHTQQVAGATIRADTSIKQRVPRSQRSGEIVEPLVSEQWFVKTKVLSYIILVDIVNISLTLADCDTSRP